MIKAGITGWITRGASATPNTAEFISTTPTKEGTTQMNWLSTLLGLIPIIATGIQTLHADKTLGDKTQMAQDALTLATAGASVALPPAEASLATSVGSIAQTALTATVTALHNAANPPAQVATAVATA
jgi:hypothetical protein